MVPRVHMQFKPKRKVALSAFEFNTNEEEEEEKCVKYPVGGGKFSNPHLFQFKALSREGEELAEAGKYHQAFQKWTKALTFQETPELYEYQAQVLLEMDDPFRAIEKAERATELKPNWPQGYITLARAQLNFGEVDAALANFLCAQAMESKTDGCTLDREIEHIRRLILQRDALRQEEHIVLTSQTNAGGSYAFTSEERAQVLECKYNLLQRL